jgi:hypothetical protein
MVATPPFDDMRPLEPLVQERNVRLLHCPKGYRFGWREHVHVLQAGDASTGAHQGRFAKDKRRVGASGATDPAPVSVPIGPGNVRLR